MAKFIVCEVALHQGGVIKMEDMRIVAMNVDCIEVLHQDIFKVENGSGDITERVGLEVCSTRLKGETDGRLVIMMDFNKFFKEMNDEKA